MSEDMSWSDLRDVAHATPGDDYVETSAGEVSMPAAPAFMLGPVPPRLAQFYYHQTIVHPTGVFTLSGAGVCGDGFPVRDGTFLTHAASGLTPAYIASRLPGGLPRNRKKITGKGIVLTGPGILIYGHWLVDFMPKIYLLELAGIDFRSELIAIPDNIPKFGLEWLSTVGIPSENLVRFDASREILFFDHLILPLPLRANSRAPGLFSTAVNRILDHASGNKNVIRDEVPHRIYLSRQRSGRFSRRLMNASDVEQVAEQNGYTVVHPETFPLDQQISMFRSAHVIVGEYGSALHASIFAGPDAVVCAIRGVSDEPGFLQSGLCQALGQTIGYVFGATEKLSDGTQAFEVDLRDFHSALQLLSVIADARTSTACGTARRLGVQRPDVQEGEAQIRRPPQNEIESIFWNGTHRICQKWTNYFDVYEKYLKKYQGKTSFRMLEIGVSQGGSLDIWRHYFGAEALIVGVDIDPRCVVYQSGNTHVRIGSQSDRTFLASIIAEYGHFDFILDDGGHTMEQQITSFEELYGIIPSGGTYIVEDVHTSYHQPYGGGLQKSGTFIEYSKILIDQLNGFHIHSHPAYVTPFTLNTRTISFFDSMVVFEKADIVRPQIVQAGHGS